MDVRIPEVKNTLSFGALHFEINFLMILSLLETLFILVLTTNNLEFCRIPHDDTAILLGVKNLI